MANPIISVTQLNQYIKKLIGSDPNLRPVYVRGELSNCKLHTSGHMYFTLKDESAAVRGVMFRSQVSRLRFRPADGMKLLVSGRIDVYERDGQYQLYAEYMAPDGVGALALAFEQMKQKLLEEGLFDPAHKQPLPEFPQCIGVVTAPTGAAIRDILNILGRRWPMVRVVLYPVLVQGERAAGEIARAIDWFSQWGEAQVLIVGRGGGSMEDLWAFNEEEVARAIFRCRVPVVSAVGHETDVSISDYVADVRAPTPSAAAELCTPQWESVREWLNVQIQTMQSGLLRRLDQQAQRLQQWMERPVLRQPEGLLLPAQDKLSQLTDQLTSAMERQLEQREISLTHGMEQLEALSPLAVIRRGYSVTTDQRGNTITHCGQVASGDLLHVRVRDGEIDCRVEAVRKE
ncbi:MAG: exodeoxyribonuclease VII large subunit [Eubacteriales bacterium]